MSHGHLESFYVALSCLAALFALVRGMPMLARGLRHREHPDAPLLLARGARWFISALALLCLAVALLAESQGFLLFAIAFLLEELYETTAVVLIFSWGRKKGFI